MTPIRTTLSQLWATGKLRQIRPFLPATGSLLDIGSGSGTVARLLRDQGYQVTAIDIRDSSTGDGLQPLLYDGTTLPFPDRHFDTALLLTVLHHTRDPKRILAEAARVARQVIIIEDIYGNRLQRRLTFLLDSLFNCEWVGHPHSNRDDRGWRQCFLRHRLILHASNQRRVLGVCRQAAYDLRVSARIPS